MRGKSIFCFGNSYYLLTAAFGNTLFAW